MFTWDDTVFLLQPQIHAHYELKKASRHRRNLAITGGVALSVITAPVIAAVSVGTKTPTHPPERKRLVVCLLKLWPVSRSRRSHHVGVRVRRRSHLALQRRGLRRQQREGPRRADRLRRGRRTNHRWVSAETLKVSCRPKGIQILHLKGFDFSIRFCSGGRMASPEVSESWREQPGRSGQRSEHHLPQRGPLCGPREPGRHSAL